MPEAGRQSNQVGAVVLAAGQSRRMGRPKLILPWGERTVIEHVVITLQNAGIEKIVVVTGGAREGIEAALKGRPVRLAHNPDYDRLEMLTSLQVGIRAFEDRPSDAPAVQALLVVLGDQPTIETGVVEKVVDTYLQTGAVLVIPSYQMHRGHPWLAARSLWPDLLRMTADQTMRDFLQAHASQIAYIPIDTPGILKDMDTPEDYRKLKPD